MFPCDAWTEFGDLIIQPTEGVGGRSLVKSKLKFINKEISAAEIGSVSHWNHCEEEKMMRG